MKDKTEYLFALVIVIIVMAVLMFSIIIDRKENPGRLVRERIEACKETGGQPIYNRLGWYLTCNYPEEGK